MVAVTDPRQVVLKELVNPTLIEAFPSFLMVGRFGARLE